LGYRRHRAAHRGLLDAGLPGVLWGTVIAACAFVALVITIWILYVALNAFLGY